MKKLSIRAIFEYEKIRYDQIWDMIDEVLMELYPAQNSGWSFGQKKTKRISITDLYKTSFGHVHNSHFLITIGRDGRYKYQNMMMTSFENNMPFVDRLFQAFSEHQNFVFGYAVDEEFSRWQNASTPYSYIMANRPHEHLPRLRADSWNNDPYNEPLDISRNPGRNVWHQGYIEAIGGVMFVTNKLLAMSGGSKEMLLNLPFLKIDDWGKCLRLELDSSFLADAEQNPDMCERMDAVRSALFPRKETRDQARS